MPAYANPIARQGDFADPFVLRHNGRYYLYCTNPDLRCWTSTDLVEWSPTGPVIPEETFPGLVPFAPEVTYDNGWFYLYTSPSGIGHHVLRSRSPLGPFELISGNLGHSIDGHVLIDDDGRWYFYWAGDDGIWGCEMASPTQFGPPVLTGASMHGWTEGPCVTKHAGRYHLTLTGNHYLSPGYRVNAAVSRSPLTGYADDPLNPLLVSTTGPRVGLGHASIVLGPDLVSYWMTYHNLNPDRSRDLDLDRVVWNGDSLQVLGPSALATAPGPPDHQVRWDGDGDLAHWRVRQGSLTVTDGTAYLVGEAALAEWAAVGLDGPFTAEVTWSAADAGAAYGLAGLFGDHTVWIFSFDPRANTVSLIDQTGHVVANSALPARYIHNARHCARLIWDGSTAELMVDGRRQLVAALPGEASRLGFTVAGGELQLGYLALTSTTEALAGPVAAKPVPGRFWAALTAARDNGDGSFCLSTETKRTVPIVSPVPGQTVAYDLLVAASEPYLVLLTGEFSSGCTVTAETDGAVSTTRVDQSTHAVSLPVGLTEGTQELRLRCDGAPAYLDLITVVPAATTPPFAAAVPLRLSGDGKVGLGDLGWHDADIEAEITVALTTETGHGDLLIRASQMAEGGEGDDPRLGFDFFVGYSVQLRPSGVTLARHAYDERVVAEAARPLDLGRPQRVAVSLRGSHIVIRLDGTPVIDVDDPWPHLTGQAGLRVTGGTLTATRLLVTPVL